MFSYKPAGVCCRQIDIDIKEDVITDVNFVSGCPGNLIGIKNLVINRNVEEIINLLEGVTCGSKSTSCPDQLSQALREYKKTT